MRRPSRLIDVIRYRQALYLLVGRDVRQRVTGSALGLGWIILQPLFLLVVYTFVFGFLLKVRFGAAGDTLSFALYLMAALLPFSAFQETLLRGSSSLSDNRALIDKSAFPPLMLPLVVALSSLIAELIGLAILILAVWILQGSISAWLALLPLLVLVRLLLSLACAWIVSTLTVFLRDLTQVLSMLTTLLFFATPIIYPVDLVPEKWSWVFQANPFYHLVTAYRCVIIEGTAPSMGFYLLAGSSVILFMLGYMFFNATIERAKDFL